MRFRLIAAIAACAPAVAFSARAQPGGDPRVLLYFDPDGNHEAIVQTKKLFDEYLAQKELHLIFQPVGRQEVLEVELSSGRAELAIVASNFLKNNPRFRLRPVLVPAWQGDPFYSKVLIDSGREEPGGLAGSIIAAAEGSGGVASAEARILGMLKRANVDVRGAHLLLVSKDIDAVMAVVFFGQARAALVTRGSIEAVKGRYPTHPVLASLRELYETPRILRPPLCAVGERSKPGELELVSALEKMAQDPVGRRAMLRMGVDGWVRYSPEMSRTP